MGKIVERLNESLKVQDSSSKIMTFLVQDFLDYAQIKSGKFRVNLRPFNILESVKKVVDIQAQKAEDQAIELKMMNINFDEDATLDKNCLIEKSRSRFSPVVITDEQRLMQVLLNLQSNALKFTRVGSVTISVEMVEQQGTRYLKLSV